MALWSLLGEREVDVLAWESFGLGWVTDVVKQLKLDGARVITADYGELPDLDQVDFARDVRFSPGTVPPPVCGFRMATGLRLTARA